MFKQTLCAAVLTVAVVPAFAGEIAPDTVLNAGNYESLKNETLGGRSLDSLLSDTQKWMVREKGLSMRLQPQWQAPGLPADLKETTDKYRGQTQLDGANNRISGYTAGIPFPDIDVADPDAAKKIVWNNYLAGPIGYTSSADLGFALFSMDRGFERKNSWFYRRLYMSGRYGTAEATLDGGKEHYRQILYAYYPEDIRGLGTVTYRYMDGRLDDIFAYVKSVRRIRRLSGGAWFDPIGGTDLLSDEPWILSGYPGWSRRGRLPGGKFSGWLDRMERQIPRRGARLLEGRGWAHRRTGLPADRLERSVRAQRPPSPRLDQLRHGARRVHPARYRELQRQAQRG